MDMDNTTSIKNPIISINRKLIHTNLIFLLLAEKFPEIFPKHFELIYFCSINK